MLDAVKEGRLGQTHGQKQTGKGASTLRTIFDLLSYRQKEDQLPGKSHVSSWEDVSHPKARGAQGLCLTVNEKIEVLAMVYDLHGVHLLFEGHLF